MPYKKVVINWLMVISWLVNILLILQND